MSVTQTVTANGRKGIINNNSSMQNGGFSNLRVLDTAIRPLKGTRGVQHVVCTCLQSFQNYKKNLLPKIRKSDRRPQKC